MGNNATGYRSVRAGLGASLNLDHNDRYTYTRFRGDFNRTDGVGAVWPTGDNGIGLLQFPGGVNFQTMSIGANGAAGPLSAVDFTGMSFTLDSTGDDGFEMNLGRGSTNATNVNEYSQGAFTVGTDPAFFLKVTG